VEKVTRFVTGNRYVTDEGKAVFQTEGLRGEVMAVKVLATALSEMFCEKCKLDCGGVTVVSFDSKDIRVGMSEATYKKCPIRKAVRSR
jgi:hypothetical protein